MNIQQYLAQHISQLPTATNHQHHHTSLLISWSIVRLEEYYIGLRHIWLLASASRRIIHACRFSSGCLGFLLRTPFLLVGGEAHSPPANFNPTAGDWTRVDMLEFFFSKRVSCELIALEKGLCLLVWYLDVSDITNSERHQAPRLRRDFRFSSVRLMPGTTSLLLLFSLLLFAPRQTRQLNPVDIVIRLLRHGYGDLVVAIWGERIVVFEAGS